MDNNTGAVTAIRRWKKLTPRGPGMGFIIDHPEDTYVDWVSIFPD